MEYRFELTDILKLHKIIHGLTPGSLPAYLHFFTGESRLRFSHLDTRSLVSDIIPRTNTSQDRTTNAFSNSFFYRSHCLWNKIPLNVRTIECPRRFKL